MLTAKFACVVFLASACAVPAVAQESNAVAQQPTYHIQVSSADLTAAANRLAGGYHVSAVATPNGKALAAALNAQGVVETRGGEPVASITPAAKLSAPYFYPADLTEGNDATYSVTLSTAVQHALYVNYSGTITANWGNPKGFLSDLNLSTFIHLTDQYVNSNGPARYTDETDATMAYSYYGSVLYDHEIMAIVHAGAKGLNVKGLNNIYHVFLPKGVDECFDLGSCYSPDNPNTWSFCAYHAWVKFADLGTVFYTVEPYQNVPGCQVATPSPNGQLADSTNSTLSHELFETITDPYPNFGYANRTASELQFSEIGDECQPLYNHGVLAPTFSINGKKYEVQLEYSNYYHACAAQP